MSALSVSDPVEVEALKLLETWDGELRADSVGGAIYARCRYYLERRVYEELNELRTARVGLGLFSLLPAYDYLGRVLPGILARIKVAPDLDSPDAWLGKNLTWARVMHESLTLAVRELREHLGEDPAQWRYGRVHVLTLRHPLGATPVTRRIFNRGPWETGGDLDTIAKGYVPPDAVRDPAYVGPSYRQICDTGNWDASCSIMPSGQSGHVASRHYADMTAAWLAGSYHPMLWSREQIDKHAVARLFLAPG